jgi:hypothetical protein
MALLIIPKNLLFGTLWRRFYQLFSGPWIGLGDYNYLLSNADKKGGLSFASSSSSSMRKRVDALGLIDMGFIGNQYTWTNKRPAKANVKEMLDRALANTDWRILFPNAKVKHFPIIKSDHAPILLLTQGDLYSYPKPFKFEAAWTRDSTSNKIISLAWNQQLLGSLAFKLSTKLKEVKKKLKEWNKETFGNIHYKLNQVKSYLSKLQKLEPSESNLTTKENLKANYNELLAREEILWKQKNLQYNGLLLLF